MHVMRPGCLALLVLAGCASDPSAQRAAAPAVLDTASLQKLAAHKVLDLTGVIGAPSTQDLVAGGVVVTWHTEVSDSTWVPTPVMTAGFISSLPKGADSTGGGGQNMSREMKCRVRVTGTSADGYVTHIDFNGSRAACEPVKSRIADWINKTS